mmetsp:Transcript_10422/g.28992  ORF Transcript_10422/g.28992 Transcript_10422/m.28992 type:complete len:457 (+) Transcript_10422:209-1579(+)
MLACSPPQPAPAHDHLRVVLSPISVDVEHARPLLLQDLDVLALLLATGIALRAGPPCVGLMSDAEHQAVATQDRPVRGEMRAGKVVILLQRHAGVEAAGGVDILHEEIAEYEEVRGDGLSREGHAGVAQGEDATEFGPWLAVGHSAHLGEDEARGRQGRDAEPRGGLGGLVPGRDANVPVLPSFEVVPVRDVVTELDADLANTPRLVEGLVPCWHELPPNHRGQAQVAVSLEAGSVDVPDGLHAACGQLGLHTDDVPDAAQVLGAPRRDHCEVEGVGVGELLLLPRIEAREEPRVRRELDGLGPPVPAPLDLLPRPAHGALQAVVGPELPAEDLLHLVPVVVALALGADVRDQARDARGLHPLAPALGQPVDRAIDVDAHAPRPMGRGLGPAAGRGLLPLPARLPTREVLVRPEDGDLAPLLGKHGLLHLLGLHDGARIRGARRARHLHAEAPEDA